ncbi:MAG: mechanosensitive ion channel family protein [Faecalibacterium sp.]
MFEVETLVFSVFGLALEGLLALLARAAVAVGIALLGFALSRLVKHKCLPALTRYATAHKYKALELLSAGFTRPAAILLWCGGLLLAAQSLPWAVGLTTAVQGGLTLTLRVLFILCVTLGFWNSAEVSSLLLRGASSRFEFAESKTISMVLVKAYRALVAVFSLILLMGEFNFEITALITSLGIAGLTLSLAAQDSASNLFAGLLILIERPFNIGDWVNIDGTEGTVEDISFRSTKIRALDNSLYVLPNANVSATTINNGTNREKRMYRFTLGVTYAATRPQLESLMADIEAMLHVHPHTIKDSIIVRLSGFGDSSIDLLISSYLDTVDMPLFLAMQNELHLNIMDIMEKNKTSFAFPSTSVYLEKTEAAQPAAKQ